MEPAVTTHATEPPEKARKHFIGEDRFVRNESPANAIIKIKPALFREWHMRKEHMPDIVIVINRFVTMHNPTINTLTRIE